MIPLLLTLGVLVLLGVSWQLARLSARLKALDQRVARLEGRRIVPAVAIWCLLTSHAQGQPADSPATAVRHAAADARRLAPGQAQHVRYLSLNSTPEAGRARLWKVLSFHCNALSTSADIILPALIPGTRGALARIDLRDYGWAHETWEKLATVDPYFHAKVETKATEPVYWPGGVWPEDGRYYAPNTFRYHPKAARVNALAPWLDTTAAAELATLTGSAAPVVRADWLLWQTAINAQRDGAGYYTFLGVKSRKDFETLAGYDKNLARKAKIVELHEAVADSTVTLQPRRIEVDRALSGHFYTTFDNAKAVDDRNPLRNLNGLKFDATEFFCHLPNGLFAWGLANAQGELQDTAPDTIASDSSAHGTDRRVHAGLSCVRCHGPHGGVQPVDGWVRGLFRDGLPVQSPDYDKAKELRQRYARDLEGPLEDGRRLYGRAVKEATGGMTVQELASAYGEIFARYDAPVSLERAAADVGLTSDQFRGMLDTYRRTTGGLDTVAAAFLTKRAVPLTAYQEVFPTLATIAKGYVP